MTDCGRSWDGSKVPDTVEKLTWALRSLLRFDFAAPLLLDVVANFEKNHRLRSFQQYLRSPAIHGSEMLQFA
jgi:hypothetical protein